MAQTQTQTLWDVYEKLCEEPTQYCIEFEKASSRLTDVPEFTEIDAVFKRFGEWLDRLDRALRNNHDYEKYEEYLREIVKIMYELRKLIKSKKE